MRLFAAFSGHWVVLALAVLLGACSTKSDDPAPVATTGVSWTADNTNYNATTATVTDDGFMMTLTGVYTSGGSNNSIQLTVPAAVGTYNTTGNSAIAYYFMFYSIRVGNNSVIYTASNAGSTGSGTVTITTFSATDVVGTFSFTGATASGGVGKAVTNGKFNLKR